MIGKLLQGISCYATRKKENYKLKITTMDYQKNQSTLSIGKPTEVQRLKAVFNAKKIADATEEEVKTMLKMCFALIGISVLPDELSKQVLISSVLRDFKRFTLADVPEAFQMVVRNELKGNFEHYNNFSPMYLGKVMAVYEEFKGKNMVKIRQQEKLNEQRQEDIDNRPENKKMPMGWNWLNVYAHMDRAGLVDMDNDEKSMFTAVVEQRIKDEALIARKDGANLFQFKNITKVLDMNNKQAFKNRCREEFVKDYCKNYLKNL
jgi:hypothetical protein